MSNIFYDLNTGFFNAKAIALCVLNGLIGYRVDDKQEIRELVSAITFKVVERDLENDLKEKYGSSFTRVGNHIDLTHLRDIQEVIVNGLDRRSKRLLINIYKPESGVPFEAMINHEMQDIFNTLECVPLAPTDEDNGSQQLRGVLVDFFNRDTGSLYINQ